jgi:N-acetylglucosaminyl-diphospho-decaprenol L-rhamnosyltransferase
VTKREDQIEVVVVTHNSARHIGPCVESIVAAGASPIIVDNGSTDDTLKIVCSLYPKVKIVATGENLGYGKAMNLGFKETKGSFVVLSNPDVVFLDDSIRQMVEFLEKQPSVGITAPQQMFPNRSWQRSYGDLPGIWSGIKDAIGITTLNNRLRGIAWPLRIDRRPKEVPYVDGAVLTVRRCAFLELNGFDEDFFFYADESDLCARLKRAGWKVVFYPEARVIHVRGADSAKKDASDRFVQYYVTSQYLLASRMLPPWKAKAYARLQIVHYRRLAWSYRILSRFLQSNGGFSDKVRLLGQYWRIWEQRANGSVTRAVARPTKPHL